MKRSSCLMGALAFVFVAGFVALRLGDPPVAKAEKGCTEQTLRGEYGVHLQGWIYPDWPQKTRVPAAQIGFGSFDGEGNMSTRVVMNADGEAAFSETYEFTYQVNSNCTGTITPKPGSNAGPASIVIADGGKQLLILGTFPGAVWSGIGIRQ